MNLIMSLVVDLLFLIAGGLLLFAVAGLFHQTESQSHRKRRAPDPAPPTPKTRKQTKLLLTAVAALGTDLPAANQPNSAKTVMTTTITLCLTVGLWGLGAEASADVLELKNGQVLARKYAGGTAGTIRFETASGPQVIETAQGDGVLSRNREIAGMRHPPRAAG